MTRETREARWIARRGPDLALIAVFALFALFFFVDRFRGATPFAFLDGDAANIASFVAAIDHPEQFTGDAILGDPKHFKYYRTIHIPLLRWLGGVFGDYGTATVSLLPFHVFLQALGFYVLGRVLFARRYWAVLLAVVNLGLVWVGYGTYWGLYWDPQPRFSFQALLPFLLAATLHWRTAPRRWPVLMIGAGLLMYVHPVSTPAWAFAIWLSLVFARPAQSPPMRHMAYMFGLGCLFLLISAPFLIHYLSNTAHGEVQGADYQTIRTLMGEYKRDRFDIPYGLTRFVKRWLWLKIWYWLLAAGGVAGLLLFCRSQRPRVRMAIHWAAGIGLISIVVPYVELEICRMLEIIPPEIHLIRGIRYLVPMMLLFCLWPLAAVEERWGRRLVPRLAARGIGAALVAVWLCWHPPVRLGPWVKCWRGGDLVCRPQAWDDQLEALEAVRRETAPGSRILPQQLALELRYYALRPVVWARKDRGILGRTDHAALVAWQELYQRLIGNAEIEDAGERFAAWHAVGVELGADYLLLDRAILPPPPPPDSAWRVVWQNRILALIRLSPAD